VFKALALGPTAVGIGRPYIWGLASFGQQGVERVLEILQSELEGNMRQAGTRSIAEINATHVVDRRRACAAEKPGSEYSFPDFPRVGRAAHPAA
jgi:isopentenyl diphosphate isomerase/L-lactate dehydrogenase-like FMN-dependent dehydrogenase